MTTPSVFIVDDSLFMQKIIADILTQEGFYVCGFAGNGEEAVQYLDQVSKNSLPDVMTLDINMPVMDGMAVLEFVSRQYPDLPVIVVSANHQQAMVIKALKMGAQDFIVKPFDRDDIAARVKRIVASSRNAG